MVHTQYMFGYFRVIEVLLCFNSCAELFLTITLLHKLCPSLATYSTVNAWQQHTSHARLYSGSRCLVWRTLMPDLVNYRYTSELCSTPKNSNGDANEANT